MTTISQNNSPDSFLTGLLIVLVIVWFLISGCGGQNDIPEISHEDYMKQLVLDAKEQILADSLHEDSIKLNLIQPDVRN